MARYRRRLTRDQKLVVSAVAVGLLLAAGHGHGGPAHAATASTGSGSSNEQLANGMAASGYGWTGSETTCLDELWTRENAGWDPTQWNLGGSGAYGIPQALPASKMASAGPDWMTDPATQIRWGLGDIATTYATPCGAWAHEEADGWY
jgi:hypothetical protein